MARIKPTKPEAAKGKTAKPKVAAKQARQTRGLVQNRNESRQTRGSGGISPGGG
jgi:hypothetical protein